MRGCLKLSCGNFSEAVLLFDRYFQTLPDNYLCKVDRASMGNSLEVRSPLLDYRFIEFTSKIPTKWKSSIRKNKILLREIAKEILPDDIVNRKKSGFTPPIKKWLLKDGYRKELDGFLEELFSKGVLSKGWYDFYRKEVFVKSGIVYQNYLIRLYLFYGWWKFWNKN
jgi:asparagine synthase (glutamine-hydrolysing)